MRLILSFLLAALCAGTSFAQSLVFPPSFRIQTIQTNAFGPTMAVVMRSTASDVKEGVIPDSGHWIMEENPKATVTMVRAFLDAEGK